VTDYTAVASGAWRTPATWGAADYPDSLSDTANLGAYDILTASGDTDNCGKITIGAGGSLGIPAGGGTLNINNTLTPAIDVLSAGQLALATGARIVGPESATKARLHLRAGSTFSGGAHTLRNIQVLCELTKTSTEILGATVEADQATVTLYPYLNGQVTIDASCACYGAQSEYALIILNAGITLKVATGTTFGTGAHGAIQVDGTKASPVTVQPYTPGGTFYIAVRGNTSSYVNWLTFSGAVYDTGIFDWEAVNGIYFSRGASSVSPVNRPPILNISNPLSRKVSGVHYKGNEAAIVEVEGRWYVPGKQYDAVDAMMNAGSTVGLVDEPHQVVLPGSKIIAHDYKRVKGELYWPYVITLQEVRD
jgi:hypothetical protein